MRPDIAENNFTLHPQFILINLWAKLLKKYQIEL